MILPDNAFCNFSSHTFSDWTKVYHNTDNLFQSVMSLASSLFAKVEHQDAMVLKRL